MLTLNEQGEILLYNTVSSGKTLFSYLVSKTNKNPAASLQAHGVSYFVGFIIKSAAREKGLPAVITFTVFCLLYFS